MKIIKNITTLALATGLATSAQAVTIVTDFETANPDYSDGYGSGFKDFGTGGSGFDTTQGWTFYIDNSFSTVNTISIPFAGTGGGSVTMGELEIREGAGLELHSNIFDLGAGVTHTLALRSQSFNVGTGDASIDWLQVDSGNLNAYYSQDDGSSWIAATQGANFSATSGTLQFLIARNEGLDQDPTIDTVTVSYVPEPSSALLIGLGGLALTLRRRR